MFIMIIFFSQVSLPEKNLPRPGILQAISTFNIGQNDLSAGFKSMSYEQLRAFIPNIINQFTAGIQHLYQGGARTFWILTQAPLVACRGQ